MRLIAIALICLFPVVLHGQDELIDEQLHLIVSLVNRPDKLSDLSITDDQKTRLKNTRKKLLQEVSEKQKELNVYLHTKHDKAKEQKLRKQMEILTVDFYKKMGKEIDEVLLPVQIDRLKQLSVWSRINSNGYSSIFRYSFIRKHLDIDREQQTELSNRAEELQEQFDKELDELHNKYRKKLNDELTGEQQRKLKELLGDSSKIDNRRLYLKF